LIERGNLNIFNELPETSRNMISNSVAALLVLMLFILIFAAYRTFSVRYSGVTESMKIAGTTFEIKVNGGNADESVKNALRKAGEIAGQIDYYDEKSEITAVNNMAGISAVAVSHDTFELLENALRLCRQTGGAFDITIGPLIDIWNFKSNSHKEIPSGNQLVYAQHLVNYYNVQMNPINETVKLLYPGMKLDLSAAEKGYVISRIRAMLVQKGVKSAMIKAGTSIAVIGDNKGKPWKIGIRDPKDNYKIAGRITLEAGQAVSTSADNERHFELAGKRYHDILDPATGMPAEECRSVTIISDDDTQAEMLSKAVFVMGPKRGLDFVKMFKGVNAVIIDKDGNILTTPGLALER
jgi:thiamine biosynthesis lipoprotein